MTDCSIDAIREKCVEELDDSLSRNYMEPDLVEVKVMVERVLSFAVITDETIKISYAQVEAVLRLEWRDPRMFNPEANRCRKITSHLLSLTDTAATSGALRAPVFALRDKFWLPQVRPTHLNRATECRTWSVV
jgi:hypothetical protein|eukprot:5606474-Prymnesium_polylepis.2